MSQGKDREQFIPLRRDELVEALRVREDFSEADDEAFARICQMMAAYYHCEYRQIRDKLDGAYAPFDPDAQAKFLNEINPEQKQQKLNELFSDFGWLMERADCRHLSRDDIEPTLRSASHWGIRMDVDFRVFERLAMFARGDVLQKRTRRRPWKRWQKVEVDVPIFQRLVMIFKLRPHPRLGHHVDTDKVYFQLFKNIPKLDVKMLLPGARVRMNHLDRGKISFSFLTGLALTGWRIVQEVFKGFAELLFLQHPAALWALATGTLGYGAKSYYNYQRTRQRYHLNLTQILYFQNLDTNAGVLFRLLYEAEEQDCREAILTYYYLWRYAGTRGWTPKHLDSSVEIDLEKLADIQIDFDMAKVIHKLETLDIVEKVGDRYRAKPPEQAVVSLEKNCLPSFFSSPGFRKNSATRATQTLGNLPS